jgi:PAS domain S-box-containing protein
MAAPRVPAFDPALIWQKSATALFWLDPTGRVIWVNRAWEQLTGYTADLVVGLVSQAYGSGQEPDPGDLVASLFPPPEVISGRLVRAPVLMVGGDGERVWRQVTYWPFGDSSSEIVGILGAIESEDERSVVPVTAALVDDIGLRRLRERLYREHGFDGLIGSGVYHERLLMQVRLAGSSTMPVLIVGEPGAGKRHVARTIHQASEGRHRPLIAFDCAAVAPEVLERELFGQVGRNDSANLAEPANPKLRLADGATLLLLEIGRLPRDLQSRLMACIGGDFRLIATSSCELEPAVANHQFRSDLYCALTALVLRLAPLRERREELPILVQSLLDRLNRRLGGTCRSVSSEALEALRGHDWPGNLAELARAIEHSRASAEKRSMATFGCTIGLSDLPSMVKGHIGAGYTPPRRAKAIKPLDEILLEVELRLIETALRQSRSNKSRAADILGISRPRLYRRIKELGLPDDELVDES